MTLKYSRMIQHIKESINSDWTCAGKTLFTPSHHFVLLFQLQWNLTCRRMTPRGIFQTNLNFCQLVFIKWELYNSQNSLDMLNTIPLLPYFLIGSLSFLQESELLYKEKMAEISMLKALIIKTAKFLHLYNIDCGTF